MPRLMAAYQPFGFVLYLAVLMQHKAYLITLALFSFLMGFAAQAQKRKPNIVISLKKKPFPVFGLFS